MKETSTKFLESIANWEAVTKKKNSSQISTSSLSQGEDGKGSGDEREEKDTGNMTIVEEKINKGNITEAEEPNMQLMQVHDAVPVDMQSQEPIEAEVEASN